MILRRRPSHGGGDVRDAAASDAGAGSPSGPGDARVVRDDAPGAADHAPAGEGPGAGAGAAGAAPGPAGAVVAPPDPGGSAGTPKRRFSLRWRLTLLTAGIVAAAMALMTGTAYLTVQATLYREIDENLTSQATQLLNSPYATEFAIEPAVQAEALKILAPDLDAMFFARNSVTGRGDVITLAGPELAVLRGNRLDSLRTDEFTNQRIYAVHDESGSTLVLAQDMDSTDAILRSLGSVLFGIAAIGIFFALAAGITVATAGLRPVARLRRAAERVTATDELRPIPVHGEDELALLTRSFNEMLLALQASRQRQAELVADAGHELKTPLTSLRTNVELLMMASRPGAMAHIPDEEREALERDVIAQIEELSTLVGDLVDLAREDGPQQVFEDVDLSDVVATSLERVERRRPDITFDVRTSDWFLVGDSAALGRAVLNLMDNAAKWSPEGGTVRVSLVPVSDSLAELTVADSGPGIPEEDRLKVFERFYRSIQSRSMPGSGLGLAIVKQVIIRHGGTIVVEDSDDGGTLMRVRLPGSPVPAEPPATGTGA
ncbi:cell wall metabolism sensor histidine kinase WalK [Corynebacterium sp.]|uniref:sensor histidine kinase n=1 Tax=Corynebacterium sp. TaxID=1720 RepID=UPI0026DB522E|nr:HAMP domain-containing sensor histidine kinase [Corynebacterium sp.]MDO4610567.1 HAMP domain-containing sensor histidine kinase [Corynebacterium sp.]